jgi:hypothetical protein
MLAFRHAAVDAEAGAERDMAEMKDNGRGEPPGGHNRSDDAARTKIEMLARLRAQLALMQGQVKRLDQALHEADAARAAALLRLQTLRGTAERLERALEVQDGPAAAGTGESPAASSDWLPVADGGPQPVRFLVAVDLRDHHVDALMRAGLLHPRQGGGNAASVAKAVQELIDRWSHGMACRPSPGLSSPDASPPAAGQRMAGAPSLLSRVSATLREWRYGNDDVDRAGPSGTSAPADAAAEADNVISLPFRFAARRRSAAWVGEPLGETGKSDRRDDGDRFVFADPAEPEVSRGREGSEQTDRREADAPGTGGNQDGS